MDNSTEKILDPGLGGMDHRMITKHKEKPLSAPDDFTSPDVLYSILREKVLKYHPSDDMTLIQKAYQVADIEHEGIKRKSGEPYIIHPLCVGIILADLQMDKETIAAGILHDVVEDTERTVEDIKIIFGEDVALLVDGVTKLGQVDYKVEKDSIQAENLRKMFLAMARDIRVLVIKLADRLHNMRTLQYMRPAKQQEKANETLDIYAPLAERLGISRIKVELDDLALQYLHPEEYKNLVEEVSRKKQSREHLIEEIEEELATHIAEIGINAEVTGRVKHYFSIYKKMVNQGKTIDQIYDLFAVRIIVDNLTDCYASLSVIHELYTPIPGRFKDYISMKKPNGYQSLHTTVIGHGGLTFEIQIRTQEMHRVAEYGIAAHWKYKENGNSNNTSSGGEEEKMAWLRQILEIQQDSKDDKDFLSRVKSDLNVFSGTIYCLTPKGKVVSLPTGACPVDFAYSIHSAVGNRMVGSRVNGKLVPVNYVLETGDYVEIITSQNSKGPSRDWLKIVKSTQAKNKINQWFRNEFKAENIDRGKELILQYAKQKGYSNTADLFKPEYQEAVLRKYGFHDWDSVLAAIGHGGLKEGQVINKLIDLYEKEHKKNLTDEEVLQAVANNQDRLPIAMDKNAKGGIVVRGIHDVAVHFARCCNPIPGDEIVGFVTRGRGVTVHRSDCINVINMSENDRTRLIEAEWHVPENEDNSASYTAEISIYAQNRPGMIVDVGKVLESRKINIGNISTKASKSEVATIDVSFKVHSTEELNDVIRQIGNISDVIDVVRKTG